MNIDLEYLRKKLPSFIREPDPNVYRSNNYVYVDFETTNLDKGSPYVADNKIILACWILGSSHPNNRRGKPQLFYKWGNEYELEGLVRDIERADYFIAHNSKFEYGWLSRCGLDTAAKPAYCTQIGEYCISGNRQWGVSLKDSLERWGLGQKEGIVSRLMASGMCPSEMPEAWLLKYGKQDVIKGHELFVAQRRKIYAEGLQKTVLTHNLFTPVLVDIEPRGMHLDDERVRKIYAKYASKFRLLQAQIDKITGGINLGSNPQLAGFLFRELKFSIPTDYRGKELRNKPNKDWPEGVPQVNKDALAKLKAKTKKQREFLELFTEYNSISSMMSKTLDKFLACVNETDDNILLAQFNQTFTQTHRLSSSGKHYKIQLQNQDNRFKPTFSPRYDDWYIGEADQAQLEYRVAVFLGDDDAGRDDIRNKVDAHGYTASIIFREDWAACGGDRNTSAGKECRRLSKPHTFKPLYGGHSGTPREVEYYDAFREKHKGITATQKDWVDTVYRTKELEVITGLKFYWRTAKMNHNGKLIRPDGRPVDQSVCNTPVQYLATAEIVPISAIYTWHFMRAAKMESFLINTVHDSIIGEIHPEETELFRQIVVKCMEEIPIWYMKKVYGFEFDVPLEAEVEFNKHWSDSVYWQEEYLDVAA
jgi:DNA polymerase I-like protein with 3'-5' exonuclease and polymerase domains